MKDLCFGETGFQHLSFFENEALECPKISRIDAPYDRRLAPPQRSLPRWDLG